MQFEKLYFAALKRKIGNRALALSINVNHSSIKKYERVLNWMKKHQQEHQMKHLLKVNIDAEEISQDNLT